MPLNMKQIGNCADLSSGRRSPIVGLTGALVGILCFALLHHPGQAFSATLPASYSLNLSWDPSSSIEVTGYHVYSGTASGVYTNIQVVGDVTTATVSGLLSGVTYYFALTSVDAIGQESVFSDEISYRQELPGAQLQLHSVAGGQFRLTVTGPAGQAYAIEATQDFLAWAVIGTVTIGAGGSQDFTDSTAASFKQRFYRTRETP